VVARGVAPVRLRHDVRRGALEDGDVAGRALQVGDELDGAGARADHSDPAGAEVEVVVPPRRVEGRATERLDAGERRHEGARQLADRRHDEVDLQVGRGPVSGTARPRRHGPAAPLLVVRRGDHLGPRADQPEQPFSLGDVLDVGEDLRLLAVAPRPLRVGGERVGVERGRHVARGAGVGVVAPDPAHPVGLLQHGHPGDAAPHQLARGSEPSEARTDDCGGELPPRRSG
jgi:hypothetical protein